MTSYYNYLNVQIESHKDIKQTNMTEKKDFYKIYSPKLFKLAPRQDIYLDLKFIAIIKRTWIKIGSQRLGFKQNKRRHYSTTYIKQKFYKDI